LLLRGVNGSGKSTAMNMLLPFLLDADTRRIDAAGEQSGALRSWMLSGRDEPQGYLWLEVAKGKSYLSFGCGIRANRGTDQITTWWFITSRRPGIDLPLVEGRVPVSREALRAAISPDPLFGHEQRADYRAELRRRLFGGADTEQHLHLLRIVRNPRVGDRLDAELPQYLQNALPQLSDAALDDAAQPLEDLEEHRRNLADLRRTADTLDIATVRARSCTVSPIGRSTRRECRATVVAMRRRPGRRTTWFTSPTVLGRVSGVFLWRKLGRGSAGDPSRLFQLGLSSGSPAHLVENGQKRPPQIRLGFPQSARSFCAIGSIRRDVALNGDSALFLCELWFT